MERQVGRQAFASLAMHTLCTRETGHIVGARKWRERQAGRQAGIC